MGGFLITLVFFVLLLVHRLFVGWYDRRRIQRYFRDIGSTAQTIMWRPYSQFWGEYFTRTYEVSSLDINGQQHCALYRTGFWLGTWKHSPLTGLRKKT